MDEMDVSENEGMEEEKDTVQEEGESEGGKTDRALNRWLEEKKGIYAGNSNFIQLDLDRNDGFLEYARSLVNALNMRIILEKASIDYYKLRVADYELSKKKGAGNDKGYAKANMYLVQHQELLKSYQQIKDRIYIEVNRLNSRKSEYYRSVFNYLFLDGLTRDQIVSATGLDKQAIKEAIADIKADLFDDNY